MIEGESLYWLYSTIPQVLAALVGILAAFVIFRINRLEELAFRRAKSIYKDWDEYKFNEFENDVKNEIGFGYSKEDFNKRLEERYLKGIINIIKAYLDRQNDEPERSERILPIRTKVNEMIYNYFLGKAKEISKLKNKIKYTSIFGLTTIILSLISLSLINYYEKCDIINFTIFSIILVLTGLTLILSFQIIQTSLSDEEDKKSKKNNKK